MTKNAIKQTTTDFHLLIPAAGNASRMGLDTPKPYLKINDTPILRHSINKFMNINGLQGVLTVINPDHEDLYHDAVKGLQNTSFTHGSNTRKNSIYNGLKAFVNVNNNDIILIHDAARPLVHPEDIKNLLCAMENNIAATLATPVTDTLIRDNTAVDRNDLWSIQTPQAFRYGALMAAHEQFKDDDSFTDDAGLMRAAGHEVAIVPARRDNIKITTPEDYEMAKTLLSDTQQNETRSAIGFDVHAFEATPSERKLMMGGIEIPHDLALTGHSDADVVLHAVTDALLGTINQGDIGTHFPPSDNQWKDADSAIFLEKTAELLRDNNAKITFIDVTIMAEAPKIGVHRPAMQNRIAEILKISPQRVSIKATTTEGLGFTGRKEGIAAQAMATITLPISDD